MKFLAEIGETQIAFELATGNGQLKLSAKNIHGPLDLRPLYPGVYSLILNHQSHLVSVRFNGELTVQVDGLSTSVNIKDEMAQRLEAMGWQNNHRQRAGQVHAQIPGMVTQVLKSVGDSVDEGEPVLIMEAMKMENELKAPVSGVIKAVHVKPGQSVEKGTLIIEIE